MAPMRDRTRALLLGLALLAQVAPLAPFAPFAPREARAADPENKTVAAEELFQEGRRLASTKNYREACPKFLASYELAPAQGTLLNLADCYEKSGQIASAWTRFHEAAVLAHRQERADREKIAKERADLLEPRLIRLTLEARDDDAEVELDGKRIDAALLGTPIPVDSGRHTVAANAKGRRPFSTTVDVTEKDRAPVFVVPALASLSGEGGGSPSSGGGDAAATPSSGARQRTIGVIVGGMGLVAVGMGAFYGIRAFSRWADAKEECDAKLECSARGVSLGDEASSAATVSTISMIAGGALLGLGAVLFFTAPRSARGVQGGLGPGSLLLRGTF
jgi:hypothetical protein